MTAQTGTTLSAPITTPDTADTFPTHYAAQGHGGFQSVATITARDAIPTARRAHGMWVSVTSDPTPANNIVWGWDSTGSTWYDVLAAIKTLITGKEPTIAAGTTGQYWRGDKTWQTLNATAVGLPNVDNTSDATKNAATAALTNKTINASLNTISNVDLTMLAANVADVDGTLTANADTRVPTQKAVKTYVTGQVAGVSSKTITGGGLATGGGDLTANRVITVTKATQSDVATGTDDVKALTSLSVAAAFTGKEPSISAGSTSQYWRGDKSWQTLNATAVGLSNVDNTSDVTKNTTTATLTNKTLTSPVVNAPTISGGTIAGVTAFGVRNSGTGAFDMSVVHNGTMTSARALTINLNDAGRTVNLGGNLTLTGNLSTVGTSAISLTSTGTTAVTLPIGGTLATLDGVEAFTNKTINSNSNTITNLALSTFASGVIDTDSSLAANSNTRLATQQAVKSYIDTRFDTNDALLLKGNIDCSTNPNYPAAYAGYVYKVSVAGKIGGASGKVVEAGDVLLCSVDNTATGTQAAVGANWTIIQSNIDAAVSGPSSSTTSSIVIFGDTSGKVIADSGKTLPSSAIAGVNDSQVLTNKSIDANTNAVSNLQTSNFATGVIDTDTSLTSNSDTRVPTQKAVKAYAVTGPGSSVSGGVPTFNGTTGKVLADSGKAVPSGSFVGTTDSQTLTNKSLTAPVIAGGSVSGLSSLGVKSTGDGTYDMRIIHDGVLTAPHSLNIDLSDNGRHLNLGGNLTVANNFTTVGGALTLNTSGSTTLTLPSTGTVATLNGAETFTNKTLTDPIVTTQAIGDNTQKAASTAFVNTTMAVETSRAVNIENILFTRTSTNLGNLRTRMFNRTLNDPMHVLMDSTGKTIRLIDSRGNTINQRNVMFFRSVTDPVFAYLTGDYKILAGYDKNGNLAGSGTAISNLQSQITTNASSIAAVNTNLQNQITTNTNSIATLSTTVNAVLSAGFGSSSGSTLSVMFHRTLNDPVLAFLTKEYKYIGGWDSSGVFQTQFPSSLGNDDNGDDEGTPSITYDSALIPYVSGTSLHAVGSTDDLVADLGTYTALNLQSVNDQSKRVRAVINWPSVGSTRSVSAGPAQKGLLIPDQSKLLGVTIGLGQSLMVGSQSASTLVSVTPIFPDDVLMFLRDDALSDVRIGLVTQDGAGAPVLDADDLVGFTPLIAKIGQGSGSRGQTAMESYANIMATAARAIGVQFKRLSFTAAMGGTGYTGLKKGTQTWTNMLTALTKAKSLSIAAGYDGIIVYDTLLKHGEANQSTPTYFSNLTEWLDDLNTDVKAITGQTVDIVMIATQPCSHSTLTPYAVQAMLDMHNNDPRFILAGSDYQFLDWMNPGDFLHFLGPGYHLIGELMAAASKSALWSSAGKPKVTQIVSAVRSGLTVTLGYELGGIVSGSDILRFDTTTIAERDKKGFTYKDDVGDIIINNAAITGDHQITLTLASTPAGSNERVRYAMGPQASTRDTAHIPRGNVVAGKLATSSYDSRKISAWGVMQDFYL